MLAPVTVALLAAVAISLFAVAGIWFVWSRSDGTLHTAFTSALSTFAGGVLMASGLVHMMPDASDVLGRHTRFPLANTLGGAAFIALLAISSITDALSDRKRSHLSRTASISVLFVSLVFHSVVLGLSLGIASGSAPLFWPTFAALAAHKTIAAAALTHAVRSGSDAVSVAMQRVLLAAFTLSTPLSCVAGALVWHLWQPDSRGAGSSVQGYGEQLSPGIAVLIAVASGCLIYVGAVDMVLGELWRANGAVETLLYEAQFSPQVRRPLWDGVARQPSGARPRQESDAQSEHAASAAEAAAAEEGAAFAPFGRGRRSVRSWSSGGQGLFGALASASSDGGGGVAMTPQGASKGDYGSFFPPPPRDRAPTPLLCASAAVGFAAMASLALWS